MPSAHTAAVMALALNAYFKEGGSSHLFGLTAVIAAIVIYDSFGVRRSVGDQGKTINSLIDILSGNRNGVGQIRRLREVLGHTPLEVVVGGFIGAMVACLFNIDKLSAPIKWLSTPVGKPEYIIYATVAGLVLLGGWLARFWLSRGQRGKSRAFQTLRKALLIKSQTIGLTGLALAWAEYETTNYLSWRLWQVLLLAIWLIWAGTLAWKYRRTLPEALAMEAEAERKAKWLHFGKKKRTGQEKPRRRLKLPKLSFKKKR